MYLQTKNCVLQLNYRNMFIKILVNVEKGGKNYE